MTKHTLAPWSRRDTPDYAEIWAPGETQPVALVAKAEDADLILAAPDLLFALEFAREQMLHPSQLIDEAIAKAKGEA